MTSTEPKASLRPERGPLDVQSLRLRDYMQIVNSVLFFVVGLVILFRAMAVGVGPVPLVIGGGFVAFGVYRLKHVREYFKRRKAARQ
jgi:hypothetical protein